MFIDIMILYLIVSFLVGGIPFGFIIGKTIGKIVIRTEGSGNIGATNVARVLGFKYAVLTFILDGLKSFLPVFIGKKIFGIDFAMCIMFCTVIGHMFSVWLKCKGGKGISSIILGLLALDYRLFLIMGASWLLIFKITRISAVAALLSITITIIFSYFLLNKFCFFVFLLIYFFIVFAHRNNLKRLRDGKEFGFKK